MTIEGNTGEGKTTLLQKFEKYLSGEDKVTIKVQQEPTKDFQSFYGNNLINPLQHLYKNPTDNAFIFQKYVRDVYQQRMETLETDQHPCKVIIMDCGLGACQMFTTLNKEEYTKFGSLYLMEKYL